MEGRYNTRSPAVKRLMKEAQELSEPTDQYYAQPLEDNLFEWHFTVRGPADSEFQSGIYHGRIILPVDYPMKPPSIIWLTPNGRFETNKKICLSISGHHPESWQPSWSIRTALLAIIGFMPSHGGGAIGSLDYTADERKVLAKRSREWKCPSCGDIQEVLLEPSAEVKDTSEEVKKLASQIKFQPEQSKSSKSAPTLNTTTTTSAQPSKSQTYEPKKSQSQHNITTAPSSQPSYIWSHPTSSAAGFNQVSAAWGMPPPFSGMPGFPLHPTSTFPNSVVNMIPRFPKPPGHCNYQSPFFMPGLPSNWTGPPQIPPLNPSTFQLINQAQALPGQVYTPSTSPFHAESSGIPGSPPKSPKSTKSAPSLESPSRAESLPKSKSRSRSGSPAKSQRKVMGLEAAAMTEDEESKELLNRKTSPERKSCSHSLSSMEGSPNKRQISPSRTQQKVLGLEAAAKEPDPAVRPSTSNNDAASQPEQLTNADFTRFRNRRANEDVRSESGAGDRARQRSRRPAQPDRPAEAAGRPAETQAAVDYTSLLLVVLSVCMVLLLVKRVVMFVIAEEMI